jgi:hypothetical protein
MLQAFSTSFQQCFVGYTPNFYAIYGFYISDLIGLDEMMNILEEQRNIKHTSLHQKHITYIVMFLQNV